MATAAPVVTGAEGENTINLPINGVSVTVHNVILSIILFITGGYLCFAGGVHQHFTMFLVGFYSGSSVAYVVLTNAKDNYGANTETILLVVCVVVGVLAGLLLSCCFFLAVYLLGALLGYMAALWLLSWSTAGLIQTNWGRAILIVCFIIAGVVLMAFLERPMVVIATAFVGAFAIFIGIDLYAKTGFAQAVSNFQHVHDVSAVVNSSPQVRGMLGGCLGLAIVGALIQYAIIHRRNNPVQVWTQQYPYGRYGWKRV
ncbi:hypothetical protein EC973_002727 [Apophysomyces ossiformis]|uniref:Transmembrane protein 198 n=1 Tax=Apophysomyces ossiformis TaxID=679940 RepID=A0A8H7BGC1_9FUNG|nr:hypothetical protein EC973_002727 [Apophysomyces ossiformis]